MKNVYVSLAIVAVWALFIYVNILSTYENEIIVKNHCIKKYQDSHDPYIKNLASSFELKEDLKWYKRKAYIKKAEQVIEEIQDYEMSNKSNH